MSETGPFENNARAAQIMEMVLAQPFAQGNEQAVKRAIEDAPDSDSALVNLARFLENALESPLEDDLNKLLNNEHNLKWALSIFGGSQYLSSWLIREYDRIFALLSSPYLTRSKPLEVMREELFPRSCWVENMDHLMKFVRSYRNQEFLRIVARDIAGKAPLEETTLDVSNLAAVCTEFALDCIQRLMVKEFGLPVDVVGEKGKEKEVPSQFVVIGMGKLGGEELNYSSDIDLIFIHSSDHGKLVDKKGEPCDTSEGGLVLHEYFTKVGEMLTRAIAEATDRGFVFRVDLRLRPEGNNGPITNSIDAAISYYENWGQTWERAAMLKARPIAGSAELGRKFMEGIEPFVYRRHLDYTVLDDLKEMKRRIDLQVKRSARPSGRGGKAWDIKLGAGGIREIEFFLQTMLMIHSGKHKSIRGRNTLRCIDAVLKAKLISVDDAQILGKAYEFYRRLEHMVQAWEFRQTQKMPTSNQDLARIARLMGFDGDRKERIEKFQAALDEHRKNVEGIFNGLFYEPSRKFDAGIDPDISMIFFEDVPDEEAIETLAEVGFKSPEAALKNLKRFKVGPRGSVMSRRSQKLLTRVVPMLFTEIVSAPDPDMALVNCEKFLARVGARSTTLSLLGENPHTAKFIIDLFGASDYLSNFFIAHPELMDSLVTPRGASESLEKSEMEAELKSLMEQTEDFEEQLSVMRSFVKEKTLKVGLMDIGGHAKLREIQEHLTNISLVIINAALKLATSELERKYGTNDGQFAIVGMGKFGAGEMSYGSDLDVLFIYSLTDDDDDRQFGTLSPHEYFAKLAQKIISIITIETRRGHCYRLDTRLRPSGMSGPLVSSVEAFEKYHSTSAKLWERQAMTRTKVVAMAGGTEIEDKIYKITDAFVYSGEVGKDEAQEIRSMKEKMEKELCEEEPGSKIDIKFGPGGMVDIEFITQFLLLKYGYSHPEIRSVNTIDVLKNLRSVMDEPFVCDELLLAHELLSTISMKLRIVHDQPEHVLKEGSEELSNIARRMQNQGEQFKVDSATELLELVQSYRNKVRSIFDTIFPRDEMGE